MTALGAALSVLHAQPTDGFAPFTRLDPDQVAAAGHLVTAARPDLAPVTEALLGVRARGGIVIVVAHRPSALAGLDKLLVLAAGKQMNFGPKDEILGSFMKPSGGPSRVPTLRPVQIAAPAWRSSSVSMATICVAEPSQNSWPSVFS